MYSVIIDVSHNHAPRCADRLNIGGKNPEGIEPGATSRYFTIDGSPWFPIMGEMHYSRYPKPYWEESILKMKAGGIDIVASYIFWLHHEEIEGQVNWKGNNDLRTFVEVCAKHRMYLHLRIGPWCHGEVRNGGFPDWLLKQAYEPRTNDQRYFECVKQWYTAIYQQVNGLLYKDDGPITGIQIENEYGHCGGLQGEDGIQHMLTLKRLAQEVGFDVPFYTATGWGGGVVVENEMLPVMGAYAALPWTQHAEPLPPSVHYLFSEVRDDFLIGADLATQETMLTYTPEKYPYALAELGPGNQCTYHRRPLLSVQDVEAMVLVKLGSGANLIGYYMYHGGSNPVGQLSTMQESKATGYWNDVPVISYDFQAPIREFGQITATYRALKTLHLFLLDFGSQLAQTSVTLAPENPTEPGDGETLRYAVRDHNGSGFLFVNNHQRHVEMTEKSACHITIHTRDDEITFPEFSLINGRTAIFPYNIPLDGFALRCATAQPLCRMSSTGADYVVFFAYPEIPAQYVFDAQQVRTITAHGAEIAEDSGTFRAHAGQAGTNSVITLQSHTGHTLHCLTLARAQARQLWKADMWGCERLILSSADVTWTSEELDLCMTGQNTTDFAIFPDIDGNIQRDGRPLTGRQDGLFTAYTVNVPRHEIAVSSTALPATKDDTREWEIHVAIDALPELNDIFLHIDFEGDVGQLFIGDDLVDDWFYDGRVWVVGLKRFADRLHDRPLRLRISPLYEDADIYLEKRPMYKDGKTLTLKRVTAVPQYAVKIQCQAG